MRIRRLLPAFACILALAGCTYGSPAKTAAKPAAAPSPSVDCDDPTLNLPLFPQCHPSPSPSYDTEGSVTTPDGSFVRYPNGIVARVTNLSHVDHGVGYQVTAGDDIIKVTVTFQNTGNAPWELHYMALWTLLYGVNHYEAHQVVGPAGDDPRLASENPERVAPGQTVTVWDSSAVPHDQLGVLAVKLDADPAVLTAYTLTDAQTLLKG